MKEKVQKILVDSGSSSSNWVLLDSNDHRLLSFEDKGLNPLFSKELKQDFSSIVEKYNLAQFDIDDVFFYGSGCKEHSAALRIKELFAAIYPNHTRIHVQSDLEGARKAIDSQGTHFVGVLGTGSSVMRVDDHSISSYYTSGGYAIGEEGSGYHIGKTVLQAYLRNSISKETQKRIETQFGIARDSIIPYIYNQPKINTAIAKFSRALTLFKPEERQAILTNVFRTYCQDYLLTIPSITEYPINFVGSIAFHFKKELNITLNSFSLQLGKVIEKPIDGIVDYHIKNDV